MANVLYKGAREASEEGRKLTLEEQVNYYNLLYDRLQTALAPYQ